MKLSRIFQLFTAVNRKIHLWYSFLFIVYSNLKIPCWWGILRSMLGSPYFFSPRVLETPRPIPPSQSGSLVKKSPRIVWEQNQSLASPHDFTTSDQGYNYNADQVVSIILTKVHFWNAGFDNYNCLLKSKTLYTQCLWFKYIILLKYCDASVFVTPGATIWLLVCIIRPT